MAVSPADADKLIRDLMRKLPDSVSTRTRSDYSLRSVVFAAAALLLVTGFLFYRSTIPPEVARVTGLSGPVQWTGEGGRVEEITSVGHVLHGGTLT